jgi:hypothetical protein
MDSIKDKKVEKIELSHKAVLKATYFPLNGPKLNPSIVELSPQQNLLNNNALER